MSYLYKDSPEKALKQIKSFMQSDSEHGIKLLNELLDVILDSTKLDEWKNVVVWLRVLSSEGLKWEEFARKVQEKDSSPFCGCVWTSDFVAYRCRTCATSPCMSLCAACFERGNHEGHNYNMFRSEAGGACDCGDSHVMLASGFCSHHGPNRIQHHHLPSNFIQFAKIVVKRMLISFFHILRSQSLKLSNDHEKTWQQLSTEIKQMVEFLHELIKLGSIIINTITDFLLDEKVYEDFGNCRNYSFLLDPKSPQTRFHLQTFDWFKTALQQLKQPVVPPDIDRSIEFGESRRYKRFIDELTFWIVKYDFIEPIILLVLKLLSNFQMKCEFAKAFTHHYARIACALHLSLNSDQLTNRVVHISVQLFSNEEITFSLAEKCHLVQIFLIGLYNVLHIHQEDSTTGPHDNHRVLSVPEEVNGRSHAYWPIASDFINFLGHPKVMEFFLNHDHLLRSWIEMLVPMCGMELNHRSFEGPIKHDPQNMLHQFYMVRETCGGPLLCLLDFLQDSSTFHYTKKLVSFFMETLDKYFSAINFVNHLPINQVSFHIPIHRYISSLISNAIKYQGAKLEDFNISVSKAKKLMAHPLQILEAACEIQNNMWNRNGLYIQSQSLAYKQHLFSRFHIDTDIFLLQICASIVPPNYFVLALLDRFRVLTSLTLTNEDYIKSVTNIEARQPSNDHLSVLLECGLRLMVNLLTNRQCFDISDEDLMQREVLSLLTSRPRTFSSLADNISHCHDASQDTNRGFNSDVMRRVLDKIAIKREARDAMEQTKFVMKTSSWKLYDPIFTEQRIVYRRDVQEVTKNYFQHLVDTNQTSKPALTITQIWPPYQEIEPVSRDKYGGLLEVLFCENLHRTLHLILHKYLQSCPLITETTLSLAVHLLSSALKIYKDQGTNRNDVIVHEFMLGTSPNWKPSNMWYNLSEIHDSGQIETSSEMISTSEMISMEPDQVAIEVEVETTPPSIQQPPIDTILALLIKIYNNQTKKFFQLNPETSFLQPPTLNNNLYNLLHNFAQFSPTTYQYIEDFSNSLKPAASEEDPPVTSSRSSALRRMRAKQAREMMMKNIQNASKSFLKNISDVEDTDLDQSPYHCIICQEGKQCNRVVAMETNRSNDPLCDLDDEDQIDSASKDTESMNCEFGLICFIQESTVLGERRLLDGRSKIDLLEKSDVRCKEMIQEVLCDYENSPFYITIEVLTQTSEQKGIHISTCGHYVHQKCHDDYINTVRSAERVSYSDVMQIGFSCPICRQTSNFILPIELEHVTNMWGVETELVVKRIYSALYNQMPAYPTNYQFYFYSILRHNINQHLMQIEDMFPSDHLESLLEDQQGSTFGFDRRLVNRKIPIKEIFLMYYAIGKNQQENEIDLERDERVTRLHNRLSLNEVFMTNPQDMPLLFVDPSSLLIQLMTYSDLTFENFKSFLIDVFHLTFIKSLIFVIRHFYEDEKNNWLLRSDNVTSKTRPLAWVIGRILQEIPRDFLKDDPLLQDTTVFSPMAILNIVENKMMKFLKISSLLQYLLFKENCPDLKDITLNSSLNSPALFYMKFLGLSTFHPETFSQFHIYESLDINKLDVYIRKLFSEASQYMKNEISQSRRLIAFHHPWKLPRLINMPSSYHTFFQFYRQQTCSYCHQVPSQPVVCLVCGFHICHPITCMYHSTSRNRMQSTLYTHAAYCGDGIGIFIFVNSAIILILKSRKQCQWGTLYLDENGEEDIGWKRGRPLYLKEQRLELLEKQWRRNLFIHTCKGWTL